MSQPPEDRIPANEIEWAEEVTAVLAALFRRCPAGMETDTKLAALSYCAALAVGGVIDQTMREQDRPAARASVASTICGLLVVDQIVDKPSIPPALRKLVN